MTYKVPISYLVHNICALNGGMLCNARLRNIRNAIDNTILRGVKGAYVEVGCNRGMTAALIQATLLNHGAGDRPLHLFDSFAGLSEPSMEDVGCRLGAGSLKTDEGTLLDTFDLFGLPHPIVHPGWISNTITETPSSIAFAHIDVDLFEPTLFAIENIYHKLSSEGILIVDDFSPPYATHLDQGFPGVWRACDVFARKYMLDAPFEIYVGGKTRSGKCAAQGLLRKTGRMPKNIS